MIYVSEEFLGDDSAMAAYMLSKLRWEEVNGGKVSDEIRAPRKAFEDLLARVDNGNTPEWLKGYRIGRAALGRDEVGFRLWKEGE